MTTPSYKAAPTWTNRTDAVGRYRFDGGGVARTRPLGRKVVDF